MHFVKTLILVSDDVLRPHLMSLTSHVVFNIVKLVVNTRLDDSVKKIYVDSISKFNLNKGKYNNLQSLYS